MRVPILTPQQAKSYFIIQDCDTDYIEYLDYDYADWQEWFKIRKN